MYKYPKQILTISQQVQSYIDAGMEIGNQSDVEKVLKTVGYSKQAGQNFTLLKQSLPCWNLLESK